MKQNNKGTEYILPTKYILKSNTIDVAVEKTSKIIFFTVTMSKEEYKKQYSLRGRIRIFILRVLGIVELKITK